MGQMIQNIQHKIKSSSSGLFVLSLRLVVGLVFGLTFALILQRMIGFGDLAFYFVIVVSLLALMRVSRSWGLGGVLIFSLVCMLIGLLLRMYILVAPGA
jgi:hypothetical protein